MKKFEMPKMEIVNLAKADVITTSCALHCTQDCTGVCINHCIEECNYYNLG